MKTSHAALSAERIRTALDEERIAIDVYNELDSTNSEAKRRARAGDRRPTLILSESQSGGRGRMGRSFFSPAGAGIYMTYLWHPDAAAIDAVSVTTAASVAVLRALLTLPALHGRELGIKWVNDVYLDGKKVCGILTEAVTDPASGRVTSVLVGIGINVLPTAFPPELADIATAIGGEVDRSTLAAAVLRELLNIQKDPDPYAHMACYKAYSTVIGKRVNTIRADAVTPGRVLDIDPTGGLVVEREDGSIEVIHSGEVSLRT